MESLSIIGNESTASFLTSLISFLTASGAFPRFTRLSLQGVNLRGGVLELKALAEAFRLHPRLQNIHMVACWFTPEQEANMECLQNVFNKEQPRSSTTSLASQRASIKQMKQLVMEHVGENNERTVVVSPKSDGKPDETNDDKKEEEENWFTSLLKACFCW